MKDSLKKELKSVFDAPAPLRKDMFLKQLNYPKPRRIDFIFSQVGYIRKRIWILSVLVFLSTLYGLYICNAPNSLIWFISSILPFISLVSINELVRSITYKMEELEMSCKYNLLEVSIVRMGILGTVNLIVLLSILLVLLKKTDFSSIRLGLYLITPYLLNCYGSLYFINHLKSRETIFICGSVTALVCLLNSLLSIQINEIYTDRYSFYWIISFIVLAVLSAREVTKLIKKMGGLEWNSSLTA